MTKGEKRILAVSAVFTISGIALMLLRGLGMRFSGMLLIGISLLLLTNIGLRRWAQRSKTGKWCARIYTAGCLTVTVFLALLEANIILAGSGMPAVKADAVVVLGAGVNGTEPSLSLRTRLDATLDYLEENPDIPVVLTGGQGYGEHITEARCMYQYLTQRGVAAERLILEEQATDTRENFAFSKPLLEAAGVEPDTDLIAVVTNDFHIYRANLLAVKQGYVYVFGVPAELSWPHLQVNYYVRESFAVVKALMFDY